MYYNLIDDDTQEDLGIIKVINVGEVANFDEEIKESWNEFHILEEHDFDNRNVYQFVDWNNENRVTQIERIFLIVI